MTERQPPPAKKAWQTLDLIRVTTEYLQGKSVDAPRLCAEKLLAHILGCDRIDLYTQFDKLVEGEKLAAFRELVRRRSAREPIQHLLGKTEFWSLDIRCDARALVPRPETELLVGAALGLLSETETPKIADIGTGTGCIAIALAGELPKATIVASDCSADALQLAEENIRAHKLSNRISLAQGDLAEPFLENGMKGTFDLVVSNPPYVASAEMSVLQPEVRDHDPAMALCGGDDGVDLIKRLLHEAPPILRAEGAIVLEIGDGQSGAVKELMCEEGWAVVHVFSDLAGIERVIVGKKVSDG